MIAIKRIQKEDIPTGLQEQLETLYKELNSEIEQLTLKEVLITLNPAEVVCAFDGTRLIGIAMMAKYNVISGYKGMIEDVVVSKNYRGQGIGRKLMELLLERAKKCKLNDVLLFSGHHRTPAIGLYKSLGFQLKNSGLYVKKMI
ncbi:GNAT family N-acetyltransferase [Maribacter sp. 2304DJ31-5]|uniref:GNAT family N-acetyltransferase n=1 Tax=Maribacter sp. 2304DJ31-5 TaxID=3386273 RepID=UPI0039BD90D5